MTKFLTWRKMTWAILLWTGAMLVWTLVAVSTASDAAAACVTDFGASSAFLTKQECIDASSTGIRLGILIPGVLWLPGALVLGLIWFETRALWRQGRGLRLRRLHSLEMIPEKHSQAQA